MVNQSLNRSISPNPDVKTILLNMREESSRTKARQFSTGNDVRDFFSSLISKTSERPPELEWRLCVEKKKCTMGCPKSYQGQTHGN